ncbi:AAA family ATPase [Desulfococcaceae bacterium HSG8]|nr:AAA family ATPase [Desulfococcaceae bacterium HSG8]
MRIKEVNISNFRCIRELKLDFHERMNIFVGINGSGKSSILNCLSLLLLQLFIKMKNIKGKGRLFSENDITVGESLTKNSIKISWHLRNAAEEVGWCMTKDSGRKKTKSDFNGLNKFVQKIYDEPDQSNRPDLPIGVYYPVNRYVIDIPLQIREHETEQLTTACQTLSSGRNGFSSFFKWFRNREDLENEERIYQSDYRDRQLEAVRTATESFLPGFQNLRVRRSPLRMTVQKGTEEIIVDQLSDGEKCLLAMAGDLARRLAIANPSASNPLHGKGVVMIDEIDLHLHPSWQRMIVPLLESTFPDCQFILTTHSAQVLSHVRNPGSIFLLKFTDHGIQAGHPESVYGLDSNRILEDLMEVPERPGEIKILIEKLFDTIDKKDLEKARHQLGSLKQNIGSDPQLTKAEVDITVRQPGVRSSSEGAGPV